VEMVGLKPTEALLAGAPDVVGREAPLVFPLPHPAVDLGRQDDLIAPAPPLRQPPADDLLGPPLPPLPAADIGGVEKVDPEVQRLIHDGVTLRLGRFGAEVHRTEAEAADLEPGPSQFGVIHEGLLFLYGAGAGGSLAAPCFLSMFTPGAPCPTAIYILGPALEAAGGLSMFTPGAPCPTPIVYGAGAEISRWLFDIHTKCAMPHARKGRER